MLRAVIQLNIVAVEKDYIVYVEMIKNSQIHIMKETKFYKLFITN